MSSFKRISGQGFAESLGLNLTAQQKRAIEIGFAAVGPGGTVPGQASTQFRAGGLGTTTINIDSFHSSATNVKQLEDDLTRRAKARPHTRRGR